jgi:hypothetical protein
MVSFRKPRFPEGNYLRHFCRQFLSGLFRFVGPEPGDIVQTPPKAENRIAEQVGPEGKGFQGLDIIRVEGTPITGMFFRPEEVHARSAVGAGFDRTAHLAVGVTHDGFGLNGEKDFVFHLNYHGLPAIQTIGLQTNFLAGKQPANRQRFEPSLGEPFLLTVYGHPVLGGLVVEGWKGGDPIRLRMKPAGDAGGHQIVEQLAPFFHAQAQVLSQFGVVGRLPGFDKTLHDVVKSPIQQSDIGHDPILL